MDEFIYCYIIQKWDYPSHSYFSIPITSREPLNIKTYSEDMNEIVNCCQCLKKVKFEDTYTSNEIHTDLGFGFAVCEDCYKEYRTIVKHKNRYLSEEYNQKIANFLTK